MDRHVINALILLCALIVVLNFTRSSKETYVSPATSQALLDVNSGKIKASKNSIRRITWTQVSIQPQTKTIGQTLSNILNPSETVIFRGRPKYVLKNAIIVGSWLKFESTGRSVAEAKATANKKSKTELEAIKQALTTAGLLNSS
jgi:hypothetical protein